MPVTVERAQAEVFVSLPSTSVMTFSCRNTEAEKIFIVVRARHVGKGLYKTLYYVKGILSITSISSSYLDEIKCCLRCR